MKLNEEGRKQALEYMQTLTYVPRCTTREEREPAAVLTFTRGANQGETETASGAVKSVNRA